ncbi:YitT family protein [Pseudalkalibacillus caeni]|uniref:YitT family protein n=2 Tax=Exobacillus caeni TaxID=2574798 RepID=A0A5R9F5F2_9BACL|nr:YitT family protein [Pseudalkalibacillus caeni]
MIGAAIQGTGMALFLFPHAIPSGGAAGIAILVEYWISISHGWSLWLLNIPLLIVSLSLLGLSTAIRTIYSVTVTSFVVILLESFHHLFAGQLLLDLVLGSLLFGTGVGILFKNKASSGGMAIIAHVIATYSRFSPGQAMLIVNSSIFIITGFVIDWKIIILAFIAQLIGTRVIDFVFKRPFSLKLVKKVLPGH